MNVSHEKWTGKACLKIALLVSVDGDTAGSCRISNRLRQNRQRYGNQPSSFNESLGRKG